MEFRLLLRWGFCSRISWNFPGFPKIVWNFQKFPKTSRNFPLSGNFLGIFWRKKKIPIEAFLVFFLMLCLVRNILDFGDGSWNFGDLRGHFGIGRPKIWEFWWIWWEFIPGLGAAAPPPFAPPGTRSCTGEKRELKHKNWKLKHKKRELNLKIMD